LLDGVYDTKLESSCQGWTSQDAIRLPANGGALCARIGATVQHTLRGVDHDALRMPHHRIPGSHLDDGMTQRAKPGDRLRWKAVFEAQRRWLTWLFNSVNPARQLDGRLDIQAIARERRLDLGVRLRLTIAAHRAEDHGGAAIPQRQRRNQRV